MLGTGMGAGIQPPFQANVGTNIHFEEACLLGPGCMVSDQAPVRIGSVTQISATVRIRAVHSDGGVPAPVTIDRNVWISAGTPVCAGVAIGNDAFVTAGAMVLSDVAKGAMVAGKPASPLG
jgi:maltose O-acetyltransferase